MERCPALEISTIHICTTFEIISYVNRMVVKYRCINNTDYWSICRFKLVWFVEWVPWKFYLVFGFVILYLFDSLCGCQWYPEMLKICRYFIVYWLLLIAVIKVVNHRNSTILYMTFLDQLLVFIKVVLCDFMEIDMVSLAHNSQSIKK